MLTEGDEMVFARGNKKHSKQNRQETFFTPRFVMLIDQFVALAILDCGKPVEGGAKDE
jgi:hypothetical protein